LPASNCKFTKATGGLTFAGRNSVCDEHTNIRAWDAAADGELPGTASKSCNALLGQPSAEH